MLAWHKPVVGRFFASLTFPFYASRNSRLKAIKDSLQDSKIPSMPSMSSFSISNFTPDFMSRERSNSSLVKPLHSHSSTNLPHRARHVEKPVDPMTRQPYSSAKAAVSDSWDKSSIDHPHFSRALERLEGDVVILGGYRGVKYLAPMLHCILTWPRFDLEVSRASASPTLGSNQSWFEFAQGRSGARYWRRWG